MTECIQTSFSFANHARRQVVARFDGGAITSDGGAVLLRQLEQRSAIVRQCSPPASAIIAKPRKSNTACAN